MGTDDFVLCFLGLKLVKYTYLLSFTCIKSQIYSLEWPVKPDSLIRGLLKFKTASFSSCVTVQNMSSCFFLFLWIMVTIYVDLRLLFSLDSNDHMTD